jgi:hypothetical protein
LIDDGVFEVLASFKVLATMGQYRVGMPVHRGGAVAQTSTIQDIGKSNAGRATQAGKDRIGLRQARAGKWKTDAPVTNGHALVYYGLKLRKTVETCLYH